MPVVTAFYAALAALLGVLLAALVIRTRRDKQISIGDGNDPDMSRATRVFGNFAEYSALILVLPMLPKL